MQTANLLVRVGDQGIFQIFSIVFVCVKWLVVSLMIFLPSYLFIIPTFTCGDQINVKQIDACVNIDRCTINQPFTITGTAGLYCDEKFTRNSILSAEFVGSVIGLILLSMLADHLGRKFIIVTCLSISFIGTCLMTVGTYYVFYPLIYIGIIMMGFGGYSLSMVSYSYLSQISSDIWRQKSLVMTYSFWALGEICLYPIITYISNWLDICFFILILPLFILLIMSFFIVEPPQFLYSKKRYTECLDSLNYIARFNDMPLLQNLDGIIANEQQQPQLKDTFTQMKYILPLIILSLAQICNNGYYYTIQYSLEDYGYKFQTNMLAIGILQFISCFFTNFFCHKMKRKLWIVILMLISGSCGVIIQFVDIQISQLSLIGVSRLSNTVAFSLFSLITAETFPTSIRSTGLGITQAMSNFGNMGAPFLVTLAQYLSIKAVVVGGILNIGGGLSMLFVKETKLDKLQKNDQSLLASKEQLQ